MLIDILETYLILRQSDQCSRVGGCQDYIGIKESTEESRVGTEAHSRGFFCVTGIAVHMLSQNYTGKRPSPLITPIYLLLDAETHSILHSR